MLTFVVAEGVEILEAKVSLAGAAFKANLANDPPISGGQAVIDLGGLRPLTRVNFTKANAGTDSKLMIQLGGTWFRPEAAGGVNFDDYDPSTPFPELITEKVLLSNVANVSNVESITFPTNVTLRLTDGGIPFFFQRGSLRPAGVEVPDFA